MEGTCCVGAGIGHYEVVAGHAGSVRVAAAGGEIVVGGGGDLGLHSRNRNSVLCQLNSRDSLEAITELS